MTSPSEGEEPGDSPKKPTRVRPATIQCFSAPTVASAAIILFLASLIVARVMGVSVPVTLAAAAGLVVVLLLGVELALLSGLQPQEHAGASGGYSDESIAAARSRLFAIAGEQLFAFALTGLIVSAGVLYFTSRTTKEQQLRDDRQRFLAYVEAAAEDELGFRRSTQYVGFDLSGLRAADVLIKDADLTDSIINKVDFRKATFLNGTLARASSKEAFFDEVEAVGLIARGIELEEVSFTGATVTDGGFENARLTRVDFTGSSLEGVQFQGAHLKVVNFTRVNLSGVNFYNTSMKSITWDDVCWRADDPPTGSDELPTESRGQPNPNGFCPPLVEEDDS